MANKEEMKEKLIYLTKREVELTEEKYRTATKETLKEIDAIHKERMNLWREITKINEREIQERGHY